MKTIWEEIGKISPDLESPHTVVGEIFKPIKEYTGNTVGFRLEKVGFFPEEIVHQDSVSMTATLSRQIIQQASSIPFNHPEFGYDPEKAKKNEYLRYRLILTLISKREFEFELFKFKFPLLFYPVTLFVSKAEYLGLGPYTTDGKIIAENQQSLESIVNVIIKAESTLKLIKRMMAL